MREWVLKRRDIEKKRLQIAQVRQSRKEGLLRDKSELVRAVRYAFKPETSSDRWTIVPLPRFFPPLHLHRVSTWETDSGNISRVDGSIMSASEFACNFDRPRIPCLIKGLVCQWPAFSRWSLESIVGNYGDEVVQCAQYTKLGSRIKMSIREFVSYMKNQEDETPLYVFDEAILYRLSEMLAEYSVPEFFWQDLFVLLGKNSRPSYRWVLLGPERSGSGFHFDPNGTGAWNALISGRKRWTLFPPGVVPIGVQTETDKDGFVYSFSSPDPVSWIKDYRPLSPIEPIEFVQNEGEIVYVPTGWWHQVLNLEPTVCVTQNFANEFNLDAAVESFLREGNSDLLEKLQSRLKMVDPRLFRQSVLYKEAVQEKIRNGLITDPADRMTSTEDCCNIAPMLYKSYIVK